MQKTNFICQVIRVEKCCVDITTTVIRKTGCFVQNIGVTRKVALTRRLMSFLTFILQFFYDFRFSHFFQDIDKILHFHTLIRHRPALHSLVALKCTRSTFSNSFTWTKQISFKRNMSLQRCELQIKMTSVGIELCEVLELVFTAQKWVEVLLARKLNLLKVFKCKTHKCCQNTVVSGKQQNKRKITFSISTV